jgi:esterase/lipase superfamily enzyme
VDSRKSTAKPQIPAHALAQSALQPRQSEKRDVDELGRKHVRVYFATDRTKMDLNGSWIYMRLWIPVFMGVVLAAVMAIGIAVGIQRWITGLGAATALVMTVFFSHEAILGTKYLRLLVQSSNVAFGSSRLHPQANAYPLHLGVSEVTLPPNHQAGAMERPNLLALEWKEDDRKHITLQRVEVLEPDTFFQQLQSSNRDSALVFIHGYNVRFDDALRRTAQLTADLGYEGVPLLYSWPSSGKTLSYTRDEANVAWTVPHLEEFLTDLRSKGKFKKIHLVAHSMGNRALLGVVERMGLRESTNAPLLSRVVMAAPDVDSNEFQSRFAKLLEKVSEATAVYGSRNDRALQLSETIHGYDRLGLVSELFGTVANIDMIDTSPLDLSLLGHSYYGENPLVIDDMKAFLQHQPSARTRPWLSAEPSVQPSRLIWKFVANPSPTETR